MPEDKPWEKYNSAPTDTGKPWNSYQSSGNKWENFTPDVKDNPDQLENTLNDIVKTSRTKILDSEKDVLRDILKNPNTTPEQAKEAIQTMQGYHPKFENGNTQYYLKQDENGVLVPKPLAYGEKPPKGYNVPSVWGTRKEAEDDAWYTDMGKSLFNGVVGAVGGVADLAQLGTTAVTGEESKALNSAGNVIDALKFEKDPELNKPLYNTEGIEKWADVLDKERLDISPESLWGTLNMVGESATSFFTGAGAAAKLGKGIAGVEQLGKTGIGASAFTGSFLTQLGDNIDNAKEAGLEGRDIVKFALPTTAIQASIDAAFGLEAKIFSSSFKKAEKELMKELGRSIEKDAAGQITKEGFKQLAKGTTVGYGELAKVGLKEIGKDAGREMFQEMGQDFTAKAAENLWDKLSDEDKGKFGTNALDAKSFGSYIQNGLAGLVGGVPMALASTDYKKKYDEQSINALEVVKGGDSKITETKANLALARDKGQITPQEYDNAVFKIDAYNNYWGQTKDLNLSDAEKKETFELSFNIQGLQNEIPKDIESLDPIAIAKINTKKELIKGLQKELDNILLKQEIQKETKAGQATVNKVAKDNGLENEKKEGEEKKDLSLDELLKKIRSTKADKIDVEKVPRKKISEVNTTDFNTLADSDPMEVKKIVQEHLKETEGNEMPVTIRSAQNGRLTMDIGDGKQVWFAQSVKSTDPNGTPSYMMLDNIPGNQIETENRGGDTDMNNEGMKEFYYDQPAYLKRLEINEYKDGKLVKNSEGKPRKKAVLVAYNKQKGKFIGFAKETKRGISNYKKEPKEEAQLKAIIDADYNSDEIIPYVRGSETQPAAKVAKPEKTTREEQYAAVDKEFENGKKGYYQTPHTKENEKYAKYSSKGWKIHVQFKKGDEARVAKHLIDADLYFKLTNDTATWVNTMQTSGATIYVGSSKDALRISNFLKNTLSDTVGDHPSSLTTDIYGNKIYGGSGSDIYVSPGIAIRFDIAKTKHGWVGEKVGEKRVSDKKYSEHGMASYLGKELAGLPILTKFSKEESDLHNILEKNSPKDKTSVEYKNLQADKIRAIERLKEIYTESKVELEKDFGKDFVGIDKIIDELNKKSKPGVPKRPYVKPYQEELSNMQRESLAESGYGSEAIEGALEETNRLLNLPTEELFKELYDLGIFNSVGERFDVRPDMGFSTDEFNRTLEQIAEGKPSKTTERLYDFVDKVKTSGDITTVQGSGNSTVKLNQPLFYFVLDSGKFDQRQLSPEEEAAEMEKLQAQAQFEAQQQKERAVKGDAFKVIERLKKVAPKVNWVYDNKLKAAAQVKGNTITVNPFYAGLDTPIHEVGHILIDTLGYNSKLVQSAIKQLKTTELWDITKKKYDGLSEEQLGKEVLAEAIGREGAGIFDSVKEQSKFKQILDYIFARLKQFFGMDKNVAKSLAQQIISGIGTSNLEGKNDVVQEQRVDEDEDSDENDRLAQQIIDELNEEEDLSKIPYEELTNIYNVIATSNIKNKKGYLNQLEKRIGLNMKERGLSEYGGSRTKAASKDIGWFDKWFKVLSHFNEAFPELKVFNKMWNSAYFTKMKEARHEKNTHDKLALDVIKERNKKLGVVTPARASEAFKQALMTRNHKYFEFLDGGKGKVISVSETQKKGYSAAQIAYVKYVRDLIAERKGMAKDIDVNEVDMDVLKQDKSFSEAWQSDGFASAIGTMFGGGNNLHSTVISFTNPNTGNTQNATFGDIQKILSEYANKGIVEQAKASYLMVRNGLKAQKQLKEDIDNGKVKKGSSDYITLDENGNLKSKFGGERAEGRGYSKDFYSVVGQFIDDSMHIRYISPLVPVINSIEYLNKNGVFGPDGEVLHGKSKKNLQEWIDMWTKLHILQKPQETNPTLDSILRTLRFMTSAIGMWFNVPANIMNVAIGNYNTIRQENAVTWAKGQQRLFGGKNRKYGVLNKYAYDIINKYVAVANDADSNPMQGAKNFFSNLGYLGQKWGEFQIQGSSLLGLMDDKDYNSFEYKKNKYGVEELVIKDTLTDEQKKDLEDRILSHIDAVSDVQGKYGPKDRRNIQNNELGKITMQFRQWIPDALRVRYGSKGSWTNQFKGGFAELRKQIKSKGFKDTLLVSPEKKSEEAKDFLRNLKGLMATGLLMSIVYSGDDDDEKSFTARLFQKALSDVLFIFDPDSLKFTLEKPVAAIGTLTKLIDIGDHLFALEADDFYKSDSKYGDEGDSKLQGDIAGLTPGTRLYDMYESVNDEE